MKKYYLHNGTESSGPFDIEELKAKKITKASPVWFEGMLHWKTAGEIPELNQLFIVNPPPFPLFEKAEPAPKAEANKEIRKILGLPKSTFFAVCVVLILATSTVIFNNIREERSRELRIKNHKTEVENRLLELKQKELEEEKIQAAIQEQIDAERKAKALQENTATKLSEIEQLLKDYQNSLEENEKKLKNAAGFKLLRSPEAKKTEMNLLQKTIDSITAKIDQLKKESNQLKLEMEKMPE